MDTRGPKVVTERRAAAARWIEATIDSFRECDDYFRSGQGEIMTRSDISALRFYLTRLRDDVRTYVFGDRSVLGSMSPEHAAAAVRWEQIPFWNAWTRLFAEVEPYYRFVDDREGPNSRSTAPFSLQDQRDMSQASDEIRRQLPTALEEVQEQLEELRELLDRGG
jgi:hypothetical protein